MEVQAGGEPPLHSSPGGSHLEFLQLFLTLDQSCSAIKGHLWLSPESHLPALLFGFPMALSSTLWPRGCHVAGTTFL